MPPRHAGYIRVSSRGTDTGYFVSGFAWRKARRIARVLRRCARAFTTSGESARGGFPDEDLSRRAHASCTARFSHYYVAPRRYAARQILIRRNVINSFIFRSCSKQTRASASARARAVRAPFVLTLTKLKRLPRARASGTGKFEISPPARHSKLTATRRRRKSAAARVSRIYDSHGTGTGS